VDLGVAVLVAEPVLVRVDVDVDVDVAGPDGLLAGYLGFYLVHGAANVAHAGLLNRNVGPAHRATMLSVNSLAARLGAVVAGPLLGLLADSAGLPAVFVVAAVLLGAGAPLYLLTHGSGATATTDEEHGPRRRVEQERRSGDGADGPADQRPEVQDGPPAPVRSQRVTVTRACGC